MSAVGLFVFSQYGTGGADAMDTLSLKGISLSFDPLGGIIDDLAIETSGGKILRPLHRAPWVGSAEQLPQHLDLVERQLAGDFFCAPFGRSATETPIHGWSANGEWQLQQRLESPGVGLTARYDLLQPIHGALLTKEIRLVPDHPIVYQRHIFQGGEGHFPVAHHAMIHVPGGAAISFSPKEFIRTTNKPLEPDPARGRSILQYPQRSDSLDRLMLADGGAVSAARYPFAEAHEDFVAMVEASGRSIGWSAALAQSDGFLFFAVKDSAALPETLLWMSNGGRDYPPWSGRHLAVLGIEEAATSLHVCGELRGGTSESRVTGVTLGTDRRTEIRYAFGAVEAPAGWTRISGVSLARGVLRLEDVSGQSRSVPFDDAHFEGLLT